MFPGAHVLLEIFLRTGVIYIVVLAGVRLSGKREVGQMKPYDLVTLLIISNAVQNAMVGPDTSLVGGLTAAGVILLLNFAVGLLRERSTLAKDVFEGSPALLVNASTEFSRTPEFSLLLAAYNNRSCTLGSLTVPCTEPGETRSYCTFTWFVVGSFSIDVIPPIAAPT